jgi:hypothetical protein
VLVVIGKITYARCFDVRRGGRMAAVMMPTASKMASESINAPASAHATFTRFLPRFDGRLGSPLIQLC